MKKIEIGSRVRVVDAAVLADALRRREGLRPAPGQMLCGGRPARVTSYHRSPEGGALYALDAVPGLWPEAWLEPR